MWYDFYVGGGAGRRHRKHREAVGSIDYGDGAIPGAARPGLPTAKGEGGGAEA